MKHIFEVHSHITFLIAKQYIREQSINADDVLLICLRDYVVSEKDTYRSRSISYPSGVLDGEKRIWHGMRFWKTHYLRECVERLILRECKGEGYFLYLPNTMMVDLSSVLVMMPACLGYYLIEEGFGSYADKHTLPTQFNGWQKIVFDFVLRPLFPRYYYLRGEVFCTDHPKFRGTISLSKDCFPGLKGERIVLGTPFSMCSLPIVPDVLLSMDSSLFRIYDVNVARAVQEKIRSLVGNNKVVAYKFHPLYYGHKEQLLQYRTMMKEVWGCNVIELDSSIVLEDVLNTYHCDFYSDFSSVAIYTTPMGVRNISYAKYLLSIYPNTKYAMEIENAPEIVKNSYKYI